MVSFVIERTNNKFSPFYSELLRDLRALIPSLKKENNNANFRLVFLRTTEASEETAAGVVWQSECGSWVENNRDVLGSIGIGHVEWTVGGPGAVRELMNLCGSESPETQLIVVLNEGSVEPLLEMLNSKSNLMQLVTFNNYRRHDVR